MFKEKGPKAHVRCLINNCTAKKKNQTNKRNNEKRCWSFEVTKW